jgi:hypothetical protein
MRMTDKRARFEVSFTDIGQVPKLLKAAGLGIEGLQKGKPTVARLTIVERREGDLTRERKMEAAKLITQAIEDEGGVVLYCRLIALDS